MQRAMNGVQSGWNNQNGYQGVIGLFAVNGQFIRPKQLLQVMNIKK